MAHGKVLPGISDLPEETNISSGRGKKGELLGPGWKRAGGLAVYAGLTLNTEVAWELGFLCTEGWHRRVRRFRCSFWVNSRKQRTRLYSSITGSVFLPISPRATAPVICHVFFRCVSTVAACKAVCTARPGALRRSIPPGKGAHWARALPKSSSFACQDALTHAMDTAGWLRI